MAAADMDVLRRIRTHLDSFEAAIDHARGAMAAHARAGPSTAQHDDLMRELRSMRSALEALAPGAVSGSVEGLRSELRRTTDAYASLARDSRAKATAADAREKELLAELSRLRAHAHTSSALRREHSEVLAGSKSLRDKLDAAVAGNNALRARLEERDRSHTRDTAVISSLNERVQELSQQVAAAQATVATASKADSLAAALAAAQARVSTLETERDALLDYAHEAGVELESMRAQAGDATAAASALSAAHSHMQSHKQVVAELRAQMAVITSEKAAALQQRDNAISERDAARSSVARLAETEAVQTELLHTITNLTSDLNAAKREAAEATARADSATAEAGVASRRATRAERAVDAYMAVEREFVRVAGLKFFGKEGLQGALRVDNKPSRATASLADAYAAHVRAFLDACGDAGADRTAAPQPMIQALLDSLAAAATRETLQQYESAVQQVKDDAAMKLNRVSEERDALAAECEAARALTATLEGIEAASPLVKHNVDSGAAAGAKDEDALLSVWPSMPALNRVLPHTAAAISALVDRARGAHRRLRVCEGEREDLRHELTALRSRLDDAESHARSRSHTLTDTLAATRQECERAHAHIRSLTDTHTATLERLKDALARIARYKDRVLRSRDALSKAAELSQKLHSDVDAHARAKEAAEGDATAARTALDELKRLHTHALALCAHKDAEILRLSVAARTHMTVEASPRRAVSAAPRSATTAAATHSVAVAPITDASPPSVTASSKSSARQRSSSGGRQAVPSSNAAAMPDTAQQHVDVSSATSGSVSISGDGVIGPYPPDDVLQRHVRALLNGQPLTDSDAPTSDAPVMTAPAKTAVQPATAEPSPPPAAVTAAAPKPASSNSRKRSRSRGRVVPAAAVAAQPAAAVAVAQAVPPATSRPARASATSIKSVHLPADASPPPSSKAPTAVPHTPYDGGAQAWDSTLLSPETIQPRRFQLLTPASVMASMRSTGSAAFTQTPSGIAGVDDTMEASMAVSTPSQAATPADTPVWRAPVTAYGPSGGRGKGRVDAGPDALFSYMPPHSRVETSGTGAMSSGSRTTAATTGVTSSSRVAAAVSATAAVDAGAAQFAAASRVPGRSHHQQRRM